VFIEAEGIEKNLNEFLLWCHQGPTWARVKEVKFQEIPPLNYSDFKIK
jgi:acylphosphatase